MNIFFWMVHTDQSSIYKIWNCFAVFSRQGNAATTMGPSLASLHVLNEDRWVLFHALYHMWCPTNEMWVVFKGLMQSYSHNDPLVGTCVLLCHVLTSHPVQSGPILFLFSFQLRICTLGTLSPITIQQGFNPSGSNLFPEMSWSRTELCIGFWLEISKIQCSTQISP